MAVTTSKIKNKKGKEKITMLTCYDFQTAQILDSAGVDMLLIGDSLGNVVLGYEDTTMVTMEDMVHHTAAVKRAVKNAMIVADLPFLSFNLSTENTVINGGRLIQAGARAVKLEGGITVAHQVKALTDAGIPVVGHLGLTPQSINQIGGYFIQGKTSETANKMINDAKALEDAGAFAIVLECVPDELAKIITESLKIPTIGIGAGSSCDGQVLVINDILGISDRKPATFVKQYANLNEIIRSAASQYIDDVKNGQFPSDKHTFHSEELNKLY